MVHMDCLSLNTFYSVKASSWGSCCSIKHSLGASSTRKGVGSSYLFLHCSCSAVLKFCLPSPLLSFFLLDHCSNQMVLQSLIWELSGTRLRTNHTYMDKDIPQIIPVFICYGKIIEKPWLKIFDLYLETSHQHVVSYITASGILDSILVHRVSQYPERQEAY